MAIKWPFNFLPHPMSVSALPEENRTNKILYFLSEGALLLNQNKT